MALPELLINSTTPGTVTALTTLAANLAAGATKVKVNAAAPAQLQASGQFRIVIDSEILLVTGGASTTEWTIERKQEGSAEAEHLSGVSVYHFLTVAALDRRYGGAYQGEYNGAKEYANRDVVLYKGQLWVSLKAGNTGNAPAPHTTSIGLLDSFKREENPLSNGGKWKILQWCGHIGRCFSATFGWVANGTGGEGEASGEVGGAYWSPSEFENPTVRCTMTPENLTKYMALWANMPSPTTEKSGYRLKVKGEGAGTKFKLTLEKWTNGVLTATLGEHAEQVIAATKVISLSIVGNKLAVTYDGTVLFEATDETYTKGYVGIEGNGSSDFGELNLEAGGGTSPWWELFVYGEKTEVLAGAGTWTKPAGCTTVEVLCIGGGGGGGGGAKGKAGTAATGGGGGGGGAITRLTFPAAALGATVAYSVGAGGEGGVGFEAEKAGEAGKPGGNTTFGEAAQPSLFAGGGKAGEGGAITAINGAGGGGGIGQFSGAAGATSTAAGGEAQPANESGGAGGGGAGGGVTAGGAAVKGSAGSSIAWARISGGAGGATTTEGKAGTAVTEEAGEPGSGGGGGGSSTTGVGGKGGAGAKWGAGGGGGGANTTAASKSGTGGAGAAGVIIVITR